MLREKLKNKNVLFIPVFSMRDYKTGKYKLNCDGNMARILSIVYSSQLNNCIITIPMKEKLDLDDFKQLLVKLKDKMIENKITFYYDDGYGVNAKETRSSKNFSYIKKKDVYDSFDYIVSEPQQVTNELIKRFNNDKLIYWCVASETINYSPWFTREYKEIDKEIASKILTVCATSSQVKYLKGKSVKGEFYLSEFSNIKIIFFPFRISDESYKWELFVSMVNNLIEEGVKNFRVLYTDPNNSSGDLSDVFVKVQNDFPVYIAILKGQPIIPYFENANEVKHISIEEMAMYNCNIICYNTKEIKCDNITMVKNNKEFYEELKKKVRGY